MGEQGHALARKLRAKLRLGEKSIDAEFHACRAFPTFTGLGTSPFAAALVKKVDRGSSPAWRDQDICLRPE